MLERDLKKRYGHGLAEIAAEIDFPETAVRKSDFDALRRMILFDSRYPITPSLGGNYHAEVNERTQRVWSSSDFASMSRLARRVREHVSRIDGDSNYPGSHHSYRIDDDGYLALRVGGQLRPRITFRFSSEQHRSGGATWNHMRRIFVKDEFPLITRWWDVAELRHDDERETRVV